MRVTSARLGQHSLHLRIDGHHITTGEKYTIIELGYAVLLAEDEAAQTWIDGLNERIPADEEMGRPEVAGRVTSDPIVVALSYTDWWARNSEGFKAGRSLRIPSREEATEIVRNRRILNDFNAKYAGKLPSEWTSGWASGRSSQ
jgi:hypothetical protein